MLQHVRRAACVVVCPHWAWLIRPSPGGRCHSWCLCGWPGWHEETPGLGGPEHTHPTQHEKTSLWRDVLQWTQPVLDVTNLSADCSNLSLVHARLCHHVSQRSSSQVLHDHKELVSNQETKHTHWSCEPFPSRASLRYALVLPVHKVYDVGVLQLLHDLDLIDDQLFLRLLLQIDLFDGHL